MSLSSELPTSESVSFLTSLRPVLLHSDMNSIWVTVDAPVGGKREADLRVQLKENPVSFSRSSSSSSSLSLAPDVLSSLSTANRYSSAKGREYIRADVFVRGS